METKEFKEVVAVASNFTISTSRSNTDVHLRLSGDFDGTSAFELIHVLRERCSSARRACIHTDDLKRIYPFGRDVFCNNLCLLNDRDIRLEFLGDKASELTPERNRFL